MWEEFKTILSIIYKEAKRRRWFFLLQIVFGALSLIGLSVIGLHPLLVWLFPTSVVAVWVIIISLAVVASLLVALFLLHSFHERAARQALDVWLKNEGTLERLYKLRERGERLSAQCMGLGENERFPDKEVNDWQRSAAFELENRLGLEHRRRFYDHSKTGEDYPKEPVACAYWIDERLNKLQRVIDKLRQPPPQLASRMTAGQLESRGTVYLELDED